MPWMFPTIILALFVLFTLPVWQWLWLEWMNNPYYSHGPLILGASLLLIWQQRRALKPVYDNRGLVLLIPALGLYLFFFAGRANYLTALAIIPVAAGLVWWLTGFAGLRTLAFPLAYLTLMVPLPFVERITLPLALWTGRWAGGLAQALGLDVTVVGNSVVLPNTSLVIGAQCSGVNSLISLLAITLLLAYLLRGPWWGKGVLVLAAIPLALLNNLLRITSLLFVARRFDAETAFTFYHDYSGFLFFALVLVLLIPLTRLLRLKV